MGTLWRKLRGIFGSGAIWGSAFGLGGVVLSVVAQLTVSPFPFSLGSVFGAAVALGSFGFLSGVGFGLALAASEGRRSLSGVRGSRVAALGAGAGAALPWMVVAVNGLGSFFPLSTMLIFSGGFGLAGCVLATGSLALAKRAALREGDPPTMLESGSGSALAIRLD